MDFWEEGCVLRIFVGESDKLDGILVYEKILQKALEEGLMGATVIKGSAGFGSHHKLHTSKILTLSGELPLIIEIIDKPQKIESIIPFIKEVLGQGLLCLENIKIHSFSKA